jgi:hypothetical protein
VVGQRGGQPVPAAVGAAIGEADRDVGQDDPHRDAVDPGQEAAVGQPRHHRQLPDGLEADQVLGAGSDLGQERGVEGPVGQHQHVLGEQVQQPGRIDDLVPGPGAERRTQQRPGPGLRPGLVKSFV